MAVLSVSVRIGTSPANGLNLDINYPVILLAFGSEALGAYFVYCLGRASIERRLAEELNSQDQNDQLLTQQ
jgi:hypothetical protein